MTIVGDTVYQLWLLNDPPDWQPLPFSLPPWWKRHGRDIALVGVVLVQSVAVMTVWFAWGPAAGLVAWLWFMVLWLRPWRW